MVISLYHRMIAMLESSRETTLFFVVLSITYELNQSAFHRYAPRLTWDSWLRTCGETKSTWIHDRSHHLLEYVFRYPANLDDDRQHCTDGPLFSMISMVTGLFLILIQSVVRLLHWDGWFWEEPSSHSAFDEEVHIGQHHFFCSIRFTPIFPLDFFHRKWLPAGAASCYGCVPRRMQFPTDSDRTRLGIQVKNHVHVSVLPQKKNKAQHCYQLRWNHYSINHLRHHRNPQSPLRTPSESFPLIHNFRRR